MSQLRFGCERPNRTSRYIPVPNGVPGSDRDRAPNALCDYAFVLAQEFSRFYTAHHIMSETNADLRAARLGLCELTFRVLVKVLNLLGIEVPPRM